MAGLFSPNEWSHDEVLDRSLKLLINMWNTNDYLWLLGGSSSLMLQGVGLSKPPNDIDIYADLRVAKLLHRLALDKQIDEQVLDRSGTYTSLLSHYRVEDSAVELSGGFEICTEGSFYRTEVELLSSYAIPYSVRGAAGMVKLTPLSHELLFNVLRQREDRYIPIATKISESLEQHLPLIQELIARNVWSDQDLRRIEGLLNTRI
ncbi:hypothetical protein ACFSVM_14230 [Paenibacillus shunpengii]|uniref:Nucleotidyl transferase AbiEii/AbiGii toxin family protein n=1 Tax=Paenibacillus shunpengii TaxID=2054424 RepID=A0ABW5SPA6_9BACL|nr:MULTISPECIES: hypothetical protein [unclassified Paenibacillus]OMC68560.1 hypothetical protein BK126_12070 [Paenibacillus sp. FSL H7-0326]